MDDMSPCETFAATAASGPSTSRPVGSGLVSLGDAAAVRSTVVHPDGRHQRTIGLSDGRIVFVEAESDWTGFGEASRLLNSGETVEDWRLELFAEKGFLSFESPPADAASLLDDHVVCQCMHVTRGAIVDVLRSGGSCADVGSRTKAGTVCGTCVPRIHELAGTNTFKAGRLVARQLLDRHHTRFVFSYEDDAPGHAPLPGANVLLEFGIDGRTLSRNYTITGGTREIIEIIVRRETNGVVSRWLHDHAAIEEAVRLSDPLGGRGLDPDRPTTFLAAGIGVTPAISHLLAMAGSGSGSMFLHWSIRLADESLLVDHVLELASKVRGARIVVRDTGREGRVARDGWAGILEGSEDVHVCGPVSFIEDVATALSALDWPAERMHLESFVARGVPARSIAAVADFDHVSDPIVASSFHLRPVERVETEARVFLAQFYHEHGAGKTFAERMREVERSISATGTYAHTYDELAYGARLAWRNSARCIGRFFWQGLTVFDRRDVEGEDAIFASVMDHLRFATNGGDLRPAISVFSPDGPKIRILSPQILLYAGYRMDDGSVVGDPKNVDLTDTAVSLGWKGKGTPFDILPLMVRIGDRTPRIYDIPQEDVVEVALRHPENAAFADLGLRWFAVPAVADMALDVGGIQYTAAPSNGFYMGTEIGSLNLGDPRRYDKLGDVATALGLRRDEDNPLWRDQAMVEINRAVLHSFREGGVRIIDHHSLSAYFRRFQEKEERVGRPVYGHWPWIVPPMSSNLSDIWYDKSLRKVILKPNYFYQGREGGGNG